MIDNHNPPGQFVQAHGLRRAIECVGAKNGAARRIKDADAGRGRQRRPYYYGTRPVRFMVIAAACIKHEHVSVTRIHDD